jgi:hypothetical protein
VYVLLANVTLKLWLVRVEVVGVANNAGVEGHFDVLFEGYFTPGGS